MAKGAPTGTWATVPEHLKGEDELIDLRRAEARLLVRRPGVPEVELPLSREEFVIGRQVNEVDLALDDELVSKRHARLTLDGRGYFKLEDLGSKNGITYLGRQLRRLNLVDGDVFKIGKTEFTFHAKMGRLPQSSPKNLPLPRSESMFAELKIPEPSPLNLEDERSDVRDPAEHPPEK